MSTKKILQIIIVAATIFFSYRVFAFFSSPEEILDFSGVEKSVTINDNGCLYNLKTQTETTKGLLDENDIVLDRHDRISPDLDANIYSGANIRIDRAMAVTVKADGQEKQIYTFAKSVRLAVSEAGVILSRLDKTEPTLDAPPAAGGTITVTRINVEEKIIAEDIDFKTVTKKDSDMGWREKKIEQKGEKGTREVKYKITYKNGKEISRITLEKNTIKEPTEEIVTQGTYVKTGASDKGQATWYSYQGGLFAASLSIPKGEYAKVTNTANGKSVIVQINDSGPYGKGRIIDLDKVAFEKLASLGAGVINVKVERVLN